MGYFSNSEEVYRCVGRLFEELVADPELVPAFQRADTIVQYRLTNPKAQITVKIRAGEDLQVDLGETELVPQVTMTMDSDVMHHFWLGGVSITVAITRGQIKAKGPVAKILKLVPLVKPAFPRYREILEQAGRSDILAAVD
ncbi:MAG: hypothetical protein QOG62_1975 [Thermoleophilaceae bacterium]|jgi:hypothetical protein|nr:hypothetical protein [Thermoleophilaceae bacterium]